MQMLVCHCTSNVFGTRQPNPLQRSRRQRRKFSHLVRQVSRFVFALEKQMENVTPPPQVGSLEKQVGRFVYSTNSPFRLVEHKEFLALMQMVRPGVKLPNKRAIGGRILNAPKHLLTQFFLGWKQMFARNL